MDAPFPHLRNAPIREAVLDIRVLPGPHPCDEMLQAFRAEVLPAFPEERAIQYSEVQFAVAADGGNAPAPSRKETRVGSIFWNTEHTRAVQARVDGFSINHAGKYENWAALRGDAERWWQVYRACSGCTAVSRCAVRYINQIRVPVGAEVADTLLTRVELGPQLPSMSESFLRVVLSFEEGRRAIVTQATDTEALSMATREHPLVLDIDAISDVRFGADGPELWTELEALRSVKNRTFFHSLAKDAWTAFL